jgi:hypothetical protein
MSESGVLFSADAAARVAAAVRWQENWPQSRRPLRARGPGPSAEIFTARLTSGTPDANGLYPALITQRQPDGTYVDFAAVHVAPLNGETLMDGIRYAVKGVDPSYDPDPAYQVVGNVLSFIGASYCLLSAVTITQSVLTGVTWDYQLYDTSGFVQAPSPDIIVPLTGHYHITAQIEWAENFFGRRTIAISSDTTIAPDLLNYVMPVTVAATSTVQQCAGTLHLDAGERVTVAVDQTSGGDLLIRDFFTTFSIEFLGP